MSCRVCIVWYSHIFVALLRSHSVWETIGRCERELFLISIMLCCATKAFSDNSRWCRCHENDSNQVPCSIPLPNECFEIMERERTNRCRINGWNPRKYDRNDYLFKLNRSTKSSSVLVNCLHNLRYFISLMAIECARTSCNVSYRICVRARARAWTGIFVFLIWSIVHNL